MEILLTLVGAFIGGIIGHFGGAVSGAVIGWLCARVSALSTEQWGFRTELAELRRRLEQSAPSEQAPQPSPMAEEPFAWPVGPELALHDRPNGPVPPPHRPERPAARQERLQPAPAEPEAASPFAAWLETLLSGEYLLVKLGVLILFFGVAFLVKYAAQRGLFPIELRLAAAALGGCALLAIGWRLRDRRPIYAQVIQGGGIGILYLTSYATLHLYHLIPASLGFALLVAICALSVTIALAQDSRPLALMGSAGGFLAPELAGIGSSTPAVLFGYYAILNGGILVIAQSRAWRALELLGFGGTFLVSALWGARFYRPEYFMSVEPFLVLFFLLYAVLPVIHARRHSFAEAGYQDFALVFGTPILAFALQAALVRDWEYGLAWSALTAGAFYLAMAWRLFRDEPVRMRTLAEAFLALGTLFATLAVPLAFEGRWTSAAWSVEGAALVWAGVRQERLPARLFGYLLLIGSGIAFGTDARVAAGSWPVLNSFYVGTLLVCGSALLSARLLGRTNWVLTVHEQYAEQLLFAWGMLWWFAGGINETTSHGAVDLRPGTVLAFIALSCLACSFLRHRLPWQLLEWPSLGLLPAGCALALLQLLNGNAYPTLHGGWFGWPLAMAASYLVLYQNRQRLPSLPSLAHAAPLWLLTFLAAWELSGRIAHHLTGMETWAVSAWGAVPALMVLLLARCGSLPWPVADNRTTYLGLGAAPLAAAAFLWLLYANLTQAGNPWPIPYLPLVNPLDGTTLLVLVALVSWYRLLPGVLPTLAELLPERQALVGLGVTLFVWLNAILLRSIHHWCGVPFTLAGMLSSLTVQATLSIAWCLLALTLMTLATRHGMREIWLAGAGLLGTVVAKLFLVDLAGHGSIARIVSFVVVGLLVLLIGWFSPVPPHGIGHGRIGQKEILR